MVVPDVSYDANLAIGLAKQLKERVCNDLVTDAQEMINSEVQRISYINRRWVQERCDGMLNTADNKWLHEYIDNPIGVIENYFVGIWRESIDQINRSLIDQKQ